MLDVSDEKGRIRISGDVFTYLAGEAATSCFGVKGMMPCSREQAAPWQLLRRESMSRGVRVHFNDDGSVSLELHIGVDKGVNLGAVGKSIMKETAYKLEQSTGVPVKAVDVYIDAIF